MPVRRRTFRSLAVCAASGASGAAIGLGYTMVIGGTTVLGMMIGLIIGLSIAAFEVFVVTGNGPVGSHLRRLSLPAFVSVTTLIWAVVIVTSLYAVPWIHDPSVPPYPYSESSLGQDFTFSFLVSLVLNAAIRIRGLVGSRVLFNFLLGRYHRPVQEERIFLFLDLAGSSALAERLGDLRVQSLISRFFFDIAGPIGDYGGETHRYIGDEVVVTWPRDGPEDNAQCVLCVLAIQALMADRANWYQREFEAVPRFRVGLHGGHVVVSEVGDDKREIVYFGDTINTAARLQDLCKTYDRDFLISGQLLDQMHLPEWVSTEWLGKTTPRGKSQPIEVYAVSGQCPGKELSPSS